MSSSSISKRSKVTPLDSRRPEALKPAESALAESVLPGDSEMARVMRDLDWSKTPLGAVSNWSPALRMMARFLLANRFPLLLWWGSQFCQLYNDAYRPILGKKHPKSVGQPVSECWSEIWHILEPLIQTPFTGGPSTWIEDFPLEVNRHGFLEETHFTVAYSPVPDETVTSGIGGVLATVHEITEKIVGERRTMALRDLGASILEERTAEEACARAAGVLAKYPKDVSFALLYLLDSEQRLARIAGSAGLDHENSDIAPAVIEVSAQNARWPLSEVMASDRLELVEELGRKFASVPLGAWSDAPHSAAVVPIRSNVTHQLAGFLIAGISPRLRFDDFYKDFLELAASQIATAVANARAYEEERKRAEALAELDKAKTQFFSNVSHEFRTPLTLMLGPLDELVGKASARLDSEEQQQLDVTRRNALRLLKLVNTLLDFSRIEAGRVHAAYEPTDLASVTSEIASVFRSAMEKAGLHFSVECKRIDEPVYVDRDMWEKIVLNLLSNAFKFTFEGEVVLALTAVNGSVELSVRDTGVGIPPEERERVFERFHRIESTRGRTYEGTGIGLALVQELVKLHGGRVHVESTLGAGSTFTVSIPLGTAHLPALQIGPERTLPSTAVSADAYVDEALRWIPKSPGADAENEAPTQPSSAIATRNDSDEPNEIVLIADDNADMRDYLVHLLRDHYVVHAVSDGKQALDAARALRPSLVLTDVMMPGLDGFGVVNAIRSDESLKSTPVILLSARAGEEARVEGLQAGADDYLVKPFTARELIARVTTHVNLSNLRHEAAQAIEESERKYRDFAETASVALHWVGPDGTILWANKAELDMLGYRAEEYIGRNIAEFHVDRPVLEDILNRLCKGETLHERAARLRAKDGSIRHVIIDSSVLFEDGKFVHTRCFTRDITDRKLAEEALRAKEQRISADLEAMRLLHEVGMQCTRAGNDFAGCLQKVVEVAIAISGADKGNLQLREPGTNTLTIAAHQGFDRPFLEFFATVGADEASCCGRTLREGERTVVEDVTKSEVFKGQESLEIMLAAGARAVQSTPLVSTSGKVLGMISTHFSHPHSPSERELRLIDLLARHAADYIEHKQAEVALHESEERFRAIVETTPECVKLVARDGTLLQMNSAGLQMIGAESAEMVVGRSAYDIIAPEDRDRFRRFNEDICNGKYGSLEFDIIGFKGERRHMATQAAPLRNPDGSVVHLAVARDITDRKRTEEALRESEERYRTVAETAADAIISIDENSSILFANSATAQVFGYTPDEIIGKNLTMLMPDYMRHVHEAGLERYVATGKRHLNWDATELPGLHKDGREIPMEVSFGEYTKGGKHYFTGFARDITERKAAEKALRESEQKLRVVTEATPVMIWMSGTDKLCFYFNKSWLDFVGRTLEQEMGNGWAENVHPEDFERCLQIYVQSFEARQPFEMEYRLRHHSGQYRWILDHGVPRYGPDGTFEGYVGGCLDIHDQKETTEKLRAASEALRASEERFRALVTASSYVVYRMSPDWSEMWQLDGGGFISDTRHAIANWIDVYIQPDDQPTVLAAIRQAIERKSVFELEHRVRRVDGTLGWTLSRAVPVFDNEGNIREWFGAATDVTARRNAEEAQRRLAVIVKSSDDAIISKDLNGIVTSWNPAAEKLFGYSAQEMIGRPIVTIIPPELQQDEQTILATIGRGEAIDHFDTVRLTKSGDRIHVSVTVSPIRDEAGNVVGAAKIARDITRQKQAEQALRTTERLAAVGRLAATVAHEINNPLAAVTNLVYLSKQQAVRREIREFLASAEEELERIAHLTKQTLGFYRETKAPVVITLGSVVESTISVFASRARNKGITITSEIKQDPEIYAGPSELRQLVGNLLSNSIDAVESGGQIRIRVSAVSKSGLFGKAVRLTVADSGSGIPDQARARIFEPFFTTKKDVGTGLGLWICREIVERYSGSIRIWSSTAPGRSGTIVSVVLPISNQEQAITDALRQAV